MILVKRARPPAGRGAPAAVKAAVPGATVTYAQGCDTSCTSTAGFGAAVSAAQAAAVTVFVVGEPAADSGEGCALEG